MKEEQSKYSWNHKSI